MSSSSAFGVGCSAAVGDGVETIRSSLGGAVAGGSLKKSTPLGHPSVASTPRAGGGGHTLAGEGSCGVALMLERNGPGEQGVAGGESEGALSLQLCSHISATNNATVFPESF